MREAKSTTPKALIMYPLQINNRPVMDYFSNKALNLLAFAGGTGATITSIVLDNLPAVMYWVVGGGIVLILKVMKARQDMRHKEQEFQLEIRLKEAQVAEQIKDLSNESD